MKKEKDTFDFLSQKEREVAIKELIAFYEQEKDEEIGIVAAEEILDFFLEMMGSTLYNKGMKEAQRHIKRTFENLEVDLDLLLHK